MAYNYAAFFEDPIDSSIEPFHLPINEKLAFIREAVSRNRTLTEVLSRASTLDLPGWYLNCLECSYWKTS